MLVRGISGAVDFSGGHTPGLADIIACVNPASYQCDSWLNSIGRSISARLNDGICVLGSQPDSFLTSSRSRASICADAEIHNRVDILRYLASPDLTSLSSDAALLLAAWEKWGESCASYLVGEFSFAIWDPSRRRLFCCRDHLGTRPFLYWREGSRVAFGSDPLSVLSLPGVPRVLNRGKLAAGATRSECGPEMHEETLHAGIFSVPSATSITFEGSTTKKHVYWNPEEVSPSARISEDDVMDGLRELLFEAVKCRIDRKTNIAALLSGGLDSSSVVALAARLLAESNRSVLAIAAVLPESSKPAFTDEREFIDQFRSWAGVKIEYVAPEGGGPFDGIENPTDFAPTPLRYTRQYLSNALQEAVASSGADIILDGGWGEAGPTTVGQGYYLELASRMRWLTLGRELERSWVVRRLSPVRAMAREIRPTYFPNRAIAPQFLLSPDFLGAFPQVPNPAEFRWPDHRRVQTLRILRRMSTHANRTPPVFCGVPATFPFLDKRILEFCLKAPGDLKVRDGYPRYLIRRALDGILPKAIQWRTTKRPFAPDYSKRYRSQLGKARAFAAAIPARDPVRTVVDVERLRCLLDQPDSPSGRAGALSLVPATIYLICFLRQFSEFRL